MTHTIIKFKTKPKALCVYGAPDQLEGWAIVEDGLKVPKLTRKHVVRASKRLSGFINSDMCAAMIAREMRERFGAAATGFSMANLPRGVTVEEKGFMVEVTVDLAP